MKRALLLVAVFACFEAGGQAQTPKPAAHPAQAAPPARSEAVAKAAATAAYAQLPLAFEENRGQTDSRVRFLSRGAGYELFLTPDEAVLALSNGIADIPCTPRLKATGEPCRNPGDPPRAQGTYLGLKMLGANSSAKLVGAEELPGKTNYFLGNDPKKWRTRISNFGKVRYRNLYPGIDLIYYGNHQQLESDFILSPGADPKQIQFEVAGARHMRVDAQGALVLETAVGEARLLHPGIYQTVNGARRRVSGHYVLLSENRVGFEVGPYDRSHPLIIDPTLVYSTYLGGSTLSGDVAFGIAIDSLGNAYVTGRETSADFPGSGAFHVAQFQFFQFTQTIFVTKFNPAGNALVYSTLINGASSAASGSGFGIAVESTGAAYVVGNTNAADFPTVNPFQSTLGNSGESAFVMKLGPDGSTIVYSTYFGGRNVGDVTDGNAIALDSSKNAYVAGDTNSFNFPTVSPLQAALNGSQSGSQNGFVAKLDTNGQPIFSTYLGGSGPNSFTAASDAAFAIAVDGNNSAYVTGQTNSSNFPVASTGTPFQSALKGFQDAFVSKFNPAGSALVYSTYLGGTDNITGVGAGDAAFGIAVDSTGNAYVTGQTDSNDFPMQGAVQSTAQGLLDAFVTKINPTGTAPLVYSTYLGGEKNDHANGISLDGSNNAYVAGVTASSSFKLVNSLQGSLAGARTVFVTRVNAAGNAFDYSTYFGGNGSDRATAIAADTTGNAYIAGQTTSVNFPILGPVQSQLFSSAGNAFVAKISPNTPSAVTLFPANFSFGPVGIGATSFTEAITVTNSTNSTVTGITPSLTGANSTDFAIVGTGTTCTNGSSLVAGANCIILVTFSPIAQDLRNATLSVTDNGPGSPQTVPLTGFGAVPEVALSATTITFGNQSLNVAVFQGVQITNPSPVPLHVSSLQLSGPNATDFTASGCSIAVSPGGSCFISVIFTPTAAGARTATLLINDDAAGSPHIVALTGTGVAQVIAIPSTVTFSPQLVTTTSPFTNGTTLVNGSGVAITLGTSNPAGVVEGGANPGDFPFNTAPGTITCTNGLVMAPGATCFVGIKFAPTVSGSRTATVSFNYTGFAGSPVVVNLTGVGLTGVSLQVNPLNFGNQFVGFPANRFDILYNGTTPSLNVTSIDMGGTNPNDFTVALDPSCPSNSVLAPQTTCTLDLTFTPAALGARSATATINFTGPAGSPLVLSLTGTGVPGPILLSTTQLAFGGQLVGETSAPLRVVLTNDSKTADLHISAPAFSGPNGTEFTALSTSTCVGSLTVKTGGNCFLDVVFAPTGTGPRTGTLTFTDDGPGSPRNVTLTGTGQPPAITTSVSTLDFGNVTVGKPSAAESVFLINGGNALLTVTANATITGTNATEFVVSTPATTCVNSAKVLGQGGTCAVTIVFTPTATGTRTATLTIADNGAGSPRLVSLTGNGVLTPQASFSSTSVVTSTFVSFGTQPAGTTSAPKSVTLLNSGNGPLSIFSIGAIGGQNPADFKIDSGTTCAVTTTTPIPAGGSCIFNMTFTPPDTSSQFPSATITITTNSGGSSNTSLFISMSGQVVAAGVVASPSPLDFGTVALGSNSSANVTLTNGTTSTLTLDTTNTTVNGANASDFVNSFSFCSTTSTTAAPGGTCTFSMNFTPGAAGSHSANLHIVFTGTSGSPVNVSLTGSGAAAVVASPNPVNFSSTSVGSTGFQSVTVANGTGSNVTLGATSITGANASEFSISSSSCTSGSTLSTFGCFLSLNFKPTAAGNRTAQISISYTGAAGSPLLINLNGPATSATLLLSATNLNFPNQLVNTQSSVQTLTLTNTGTDFYNTSSIRLTGANGNDFALAGGTCGGFGVFLSPNQSCTLTVNFTPFAAGSRAGTMTLTDNAPGSPHVVTLNGNGQAGSVSVAPNSLTFSSQNIGTTSAAQGATLKNTLNGPVTITGVSISGTNANQFAIASGTTCTQNLVVQSLSGVCLVNITFTPTATGNLVALLTITDSVGSAHGVNLSGTGANPVVSVTPGQLNFGNQLVGSTSNSQAATLTNATASAVTISGAPSVSGTNANEFTILGTSTCANGLNVPATTGACVVNIVFTPSGTGPRTATLTISASPDTNSPHSVTLNGLGTQPGASVPASLNFGNVTVAATVSQSVTLTNTGTADLSLQTIVYTGTNAAEFVSDNSSTCKGGIVVTANGGSCVLNINFTPSAQGSRTATVTFTDNASPSTQAVSLSGTGVPATVTLTPTPVNFGNQHKGTPSNAMTVTLTNTANATLHLAASNSVKITGTNGADFAVATGTTCTDGASVNGPAGTCIINVIFTPSTAGAETATLTATDDASPTTQSVTLNGTGIFPQATPTPNPLDFGNQRQGVTSATKTLTLTNGGTDTLHLAAANAVALGGANASEFNIVAGAGTTCANGATVAAGANCTVAVTFTPSQLGARAATITFTDDASPTTQVVNLTGIGVFPQATPTPSPLAFGNERQGVTSATKTLTLTNGGTDTLHLAAANAVVLGGSNAGEFNIVAGAGTTCINGATVAPSANCTVAVTFTPSQLGARAATITFTDDANPTTQAVSLTGTGVFPQANVSPNPLAFGNQVLNQTSAALPITLTNGGTDTLHLAATAITITGTNAADFAVATTGTTCLNSGTVAPSGTCTINVTVKPTLQSGEAATLTVTDDASPTTQTVTLTATGTTATAILNPSPVSFPNQHKGTASAPITVTLTNIGSTQINLTAAPSISGTNLADFAIVAGPGTTCMNGTILAATNGTCTIAVTFTPSTAAAETATLNVADTAIPTTQTVTLNGTGTFPQASAAPNPLAFGNQRQNTASNALTVTLSNPGNETLHVTTVAVGGASANDFTTASGTTCTNGSTVAPNGGTCVFNVTFKPANLGSEAATLTFSTDASPSNVVVNLTGTGVFPQATPTPSPLAFGNQRRNTSVTKTVTLTNGGTDTLHLSTVAIGGANLADFTTASGNTCTSNSTVAPNNGTCVYNVTFTPTALGAETATLTFNTDASPAAVVVNLTGTGVFPQAAANPVPLNFGNVLVNTTTNSLPITLTNAGTDTLHLAATNAVVISGANAADFAVAATGTTCINSATVGPNNAACVINVTFKPTLTSAETATLTVSDDASPQTQTVTINGTGTNATAFLNPSPVSFANQRKGTTSAATAVTLTNIASSTLTLASSNAVTITGANAADFAISAGTTCVNSATVNGPNGTCLVNVTFSPTTSGNETATLTVTDNAQPATQTVTLNGTGIFPAVTLSSNTLSFGNQIILTTSAAKSVTVTNSGTDTLNFASSNALAISGTNATDFASATGTTCSNSTVLAATASCVINITFTPPVAGTRGPATLTLTDDVTLAQTITLSGTGVTPPTAALSAGTLNFGNQRVNVASAKQTVTVTNNGGATLNIATVVLGGTDASSFSIAGTSTCTNNSTVNGNSSCAIDVTFDPTKLGPLTATITLTDNANSTGTPGTTQTITLNGTGVAPAVSLAPPSLPFNNQRQNTISAAQTITLTNTGTDTLHFAATNALSFTGANAGDFATVSGTTCANGGTVAPNATCLIKVTFTPAAIGARNASLSVADDAANSPQTAGVSGNGIFPTVTLSAASITFPTTAVNSTAAAMSVTLTNSGTDTLNLAATNAVVISSTGAAAFAAAAGNTCTNGLAISSTAPNNTCTLSFTFKPTVAGAFTATVTVTDDVSPAQTVTLNGATPATANLSTNTVSFGNQGVGTASAPQTVTVTNSGGVALTFSTAPAISGTNAGDFAIAATGTTCTNGSNVAPGANCVVNLTFTPGAAGNRGPATLTFTDNAGGTNGTTQTVTLSGVGIDFTVNSSTPAPATAGSPITATITIQPGTGGFPNVVTFTATNLPPATTAAFNPPSVTPGTANATTQLMLTTTPRASGVSRPKLPQLPGPASLKLLATILLALFTLTAMRRAARTRRLAAYLPVIVLLLAATVISGCSTTANQGTPAGTYPVTVTATSGTLTHTTTVNVTVQ